MVVFLRHILEMMLLVMMMTNYMIDVVMIDMSIIEVMFSTTKPLFGFENFADFTYFMQITVFANGRLA